MSPLDGLFNDIIKTAQYHSQRLKANGWLSTVVMAAATNKLESRLHVCYKAAYSLY